VLRRTVREFGEDKLTDWAAALTYYAVLSIFPGLLVLVSVLGLVGAPALEPLIDNMGTIAPGPVGEILTDGARSLTEAHGAAGILAAVGAAAALWSASGYIAAFMRAANAIYDVPEGRPFWKTVPIRLGVTVVIGVLLAVSAFMVVLTGNLAERVGDAFGVGWVLVTAWGIVKWPILVVIVSQMFALLYWASPNAGRAATGGSARAGCSQSCCGSSPRPGSRSTSPTSARTTRPTAFSAGSSSSSSSGCGSPTSRSCWVPSSTPSCTGPARSRRAIPRTVSRTSSCATPAPSTTVAKPTSPDE
jgi:YihY family inner membrane protein